jgi:hypothetical protein
MKTLRQVHLYLGCLFAPLMIYFSLSGVWQVFRLNDLPKDEPPSALHSLLHELSKPHKSSTLPGLDPKTDHSTAFNGLTLLMGLGLIITASIGIVLAVKCSRSPKLVLACLVAGVALPIVFLFLRTSIPI